ncbi:sensor histidine kinase [Bacillus sp. B1-b2]|nr:sensor histidine kinase [Bacillus sp. B1-b2]KAB7671790.1 sensor histidine kinase [Bacillus sp. B1-b2]
MVMKGKWEIFPKRFGFFPYIFLVYLLLPIIVVSKESGLKQFIGYLLVAIFLLSYQRLYAQLERESLNFWLIIQILLVMILGVFYDPYQLFLGYFPANFIGYFTGKKFFRFFYLLFILSLTLTFAISWRNIDITSLVFIIPFFIIMLISPFGIKSMNRNMELERKLDLANEQIDQLIKREERVRIARDLHDTLGHTLSLLTLKSQLVGKMVNLQPVEAQREAKEMEEISRTALKQVRELVSDMRAVTITEGLIEVQKMLATANIKLSITHQIDDREIPLLLQNIISLCLKEAVTNIVRHSKATFCHIQLIPMPGAVEISIQDNGIGFADGKVKGNGLKGMKERLELVQGELAISCVQETTLRIKIPIILKEREKEEIF